MRARGFTLAEMMIAIAVLIVVISIALPHFSKMVMVANEESAVEAIRAILQACESYQMNLGQGFPEALTQLANANPPYLSDRFRAVAAGQWRGYQWAFVSPPGNPPGGDRFTLRADPVQRGMMGQKSFYADQAGDIRFNLRGPAGPNDRPLEQASTR